MTATKPAPVQQSTYTAIIHGADGIRFLAASQCPDELTAEVVEYIRGRCDDVLWPDNARQVRDLIDDGWPHAAIAVYFANVGERWDAERLELGGLSFARD